MNRFLVTLTLAAAVSTTLLPEPVTGLRLIRTIGLPGVEGRLDHMDLDPATMHLFLGALENDSLEVVDVGAGKVIRSQRRLGGPQGVAFVPQTNEVVVAARNTGALLFFDAADGHEKRRLDFGNEADNLHFVPGQDLLVLGYGDGGVALIQASTGHLRGTASVGGHPEGIQAQVSTGRLLVNVPTRGKLVSIDLVTGTKQAEWSPEGVLSNFPLAVEEVRNRGAYYTHVPSQVVLFDTRDGKTLSQTKAAGDVDDLFFDEGSQRLYSISGSGTLDLWSVSSDQPRVLASVPTGPGARTGLLVTQLHRLFVAVPKRGGLPARLLVYETEQASGFRP
jgi:DNA-binding beta-propeller fold protein YncE